MTHHELCKTLASADSPWALQNPSFCWPTLSLAKPLLLLTHLELSKTLAATDPHWVSLISLCKRPTSLVEPTLSFVLMIDAPWPNWWKYPNFELVLMIDVWWQQIFPQTSPILSFLLLMIDVLWQNFQTH